MCVTICGRFRLSEGGVAGYVNQMNAKYTAKYLIRRNPLAGGFLMSLLDCWNDFSNTLWLKILFYLTSIVRFFHYIGIPAVCQRTAGLLQTDVFCLFF